MENRVKAPQMVPVDREQWKSQVQMFYPEAFIQDDSTPSAIRERAIHKARIVGFFMRPHSTGQATGYILDPEEMHSPSGG